ncbi:hypothetical protein [Laceyella putida]|uniref:Uncharacterized protein n=1 Tax=Laceyella putida TaxID=110101 RepID=A0ABW2RKT0_9BACL
MSQVSVTAFTEKEAEMIIGLVTKVWVESRHFFDVLAHGNKKALLRWQALSSVHREVRAIPSHPRTARSSLSFACRALFSARLTGFDEPTP